MRATPRIDGPLDPFTKEGRSRLLLLGAQIVEDALRKGREINMGVWARHPIGDHTPPERNACGTVACAFGTIAMDERFNAVGLSLEWRERVVLHPVTLARSIMFDAEVFYFDSKHGGTHDGTYAAEHLFGLTGAEADFIFMDAKTGESAAERMRDLAATRFELIEQNNTIEEEGR